MCYLFSQEIMAVAANIARIMNSYPSGAILSLSQLPVNWNEKLIVLSLLPSGANYQFGLRGQI